VTGVVGDLAAVDSPDAYDDVVRSPVALAAA
jgi:hypothetical protein